MKDRDEMKSEEAPDYSGIPLERWKELLKKDIQRRFGRPPKDTKTDEDAGW